jgi:hypothetical protein
VLGELAAAEANTLFPCSGCAAVTEAACFLVCDGCDKDLCLECFGLKAMPGGDGGDGDGEGWFCSGCAVVLAAHRAHAVLGAGESTGAEGSAGRDYDGDAGR